MRRQAIASIRMLLVITLLVGVAYPLVTTALAQVAMSDRANGSLVRDGDGRVVGSELIGQAFEGPGWFHGRPDPFDPTASAPSNLGPSNADLGKLVRERLDAIRAADDPEGPVPVDAVTGSGSGLDPDISPAYARLQASRVAAARGIPAEQVLALVDSLTQGRQLGFLGDPHVNVLMLNLALERLAS